MGNRAVRGLRDSGAGAGAEFPTSPASERRQPDQEQECSGGSEADRRAGEGHLGQGTQGNGKIQGRVLEGGEKIQGRVFGDSAPSSEGHTPNPGFAAAPG